MSKVTFSRKLNIENMNKMMIFNPELGVAKTETFSKVYPVINEYIMNNQEYYFYKIGENGKIDGLIIVVPNVSNNSVVNITTLVVSKEKNREERIKIAKDLMDYAMKSMINQVNKLRISFYAKEGNEVSFLGMYKKLGFEKEAELKDEYENKSLFLYSMFI